MSYLGPSLRRTRSRSRPWGRIALALGVSALVNAVGLRVLVEGGVVPAGPRVSAPRSVALAPLSSSAWDANRRVVASAQPPRTSTVPSVAPAPAPTPLPESQVKGQVVDVAPSKDRTPPKSSRFLAEHDSTVEKETRSRHARAGYENTLPVPSEAKPPRPSPADAGAQVAAGEAGRSGVKEPGKDGKRGTGPLALPDQSPRERLALAREPEGDLRTRDARQGLTGAGGRLSLGGSDGAAGEGGEDGRLALPGKPGPRAGALDLRPTAASYDRLAGGPAPDRLDGVEEGEGTYLNTRGWKYAGYFNRISQAVRNQWDPNGAMRARDPSGTRFPARDWFTLLVVKLDDRGGLKDVRVERSSGLDFLDGAAVKALQQAQPFVNPPRGLADARGEIVFSYGFTLEGSFGLDRIFRRPSE